MGKDNPGLIVMEDLGDRSMLIENIADGLNINQWRSIVECLADLHAWSLTTEMPWREKIADMTAMEGFYKTFGQSAAIGLKATKEKYPDYFGHVDEEKVLKMMDFDLLMEKNLLYKKFMPDVLQHGDTWINNIMFDKNPDGRISDKVAAFIDWQLCLRGGGINDFARLESMCVNHEMRRANAMKMLRVYYDRFKSKAGDKLNATFDDIKYLYQEALSMNGLVSTFFADFMLATIAKAGEDTTGWRKKEMLERMKAGYDDAAKYYGWTEEADSTTAEVEDVKTHL